MNPPVEAPTSRATRPATSKPEGVQGAPELEAAPAHVGNRLLPEPDLRVGGDRNARLVRRPVADENGPGQDQRLRLRSARGQAPFDEEVIETDFGNL